MLFYLLIYSYMVLCFPILFNRLFTVYFVVHMASDLSSGSPPTGVTGFLTCPCPYFLVQPDVSGPSCAFPVLALDSVISPRSPGSFQ